MKRADYPFWKNVPNWTLRQFAFLRRGYEPTQLSQIQDQSVLKKMKRELEIWEAWGADCPGIDTWDRMRKKPSILSIEVDAKELVNWAVNKKGVKIPKGLMSLMTPSEPKVINFSVGSKERENLFITIALLSKAIAKINTPKSGTVDKPNCNQIANLCCDLASDEHAKSIPGMGVSTIRARIKEGLELLNNHI